MISAAVVAVPSLTSRWQCDARDLPLVGERLFLCDVQDQPEAKEKRENKHLFPPPYIAQRFFLCVLLLSVPSPFVCLILLLSLAYLYRLHFMVELLTWPPERECNWQPSRPEAWRAKHPVRRDPGRRSSLAYVPGRQHAQNDWSPWT